MNGNQMMSGYGDQTRHDLASPQRHRPKSLRCAIVGQTTLPVECARILRQHGHILSVLATNDADTVRAAAEAGLSSIVSVTALGDAIQRQRLDYLFSVNNLSLISDEVLAFPEAGAVNLHDGPLPGYAGLNAPSWGILRGATSWAITWHVMTKGIDDGPILLHEPVDITADDSSFSLNMKCFEAAIRSFPRLVVGLAQGTLVPRPQDLSKRVYFGRTRRPPAACALLWSRPAHELQRLVRALDFGVYPNPLGLPKVFLEGAAILASHLEVLETRSGAVPGTVVAIADESITVATGTSDVAFRGPRTLDGDALSIQHLVIAYGLHLGIRLPEPAPADIEKLTALDESLARQENFWTTRLTNLPASGLPVPAVHDQSSRELGDDRGTTLHREVDAVPIEIREALAVDGSLNDAVIAAFMAFLASLSGVPSVAVSYAGPAMDQDGPRGASLTSPSVPLRCDLDPSRGYAHASSLVLEELRLLREHRTYERDLVARMPQITARPDSLTVAVCEGFPSGPRPPLEAKLVLLVTEDGSRLDWFYDTDAFHVEALRTLRRRFTAFLQRISAEPQKPLDQVALLTSDELHCVLAEWNNTAVDYPRDSCIHDLIDQQAARTPDRVAVICAGHEISYHELSHRADRYAQHLRTLAAAPGQRVGVCLQRSADMVVWMLAIMKAGAAYVPLDPRYPADRLHLMIQDSEPVAIVCNGRAAADLKVAPHGPVLIDAHSLGVDHSNTAIGSSQGHTPVRPDDPAYVIYTSGSTGRPKGVVVSHRNVVNLFCGMDACIDHDGGGTFLAVTSISFDISVLELFWTLARGFTVVVYTGSDLLRTQSPTLPTEPGMTPADPMVDMSLFFFASRGHDDTLERYRLMTEAVKFADSHGFSAVWTPERHFHAFGGLFPNPSVTSAAIAAMTKHVKIRAGSVVSPLHNAVRIAEEWSFVDNISGGRTGISFASGWQPDDFVLAPDSFADRKALMFQQIETIRKLWRGESVALPGPHGEDVPIQILPRPIQSELPVWITAAGSPDTFRMAGERGFGVLTHLLGQSVSELGEKIAIYRDALRLANHEPQRGHVVVMLHTLVGPDNERVRELVRSPMKDYLRSSVDLIKRAAWTFPAFKQSTMTADGRFSLDQLTDKEVDEILDFSFERYFESSALLGTPEKCAGLLQQLRDVQVDEVACLIDFHNDTDLVLAHLPYLAQLRSRSPRDSTDDEAESIPALVQRYGVTHMQCTPSLASMLVQTAQGRRALGTLRQLLVGGESFPPALASELVGLVPGHVMNMYGPTETTIWSSAFRVMDGDSTIPIGQPIANTQLYILDDARRPVPPGTPGELYIGGDGVTLGYLGRPDLTADRFIADPFSDRPGARIYKTGDIARHRDDGNVEFLGRADNQVKIRGYRIELGEVEASLGRHPDIAETAVIAVDSHSNADKRLVAYVTPRNGKAVSVGSLREHLKRTLPDYMVPAAFQILSALPRTPNGKLDRAGLPAPGAITELPKPAAPSPRDDVEGTLLQIWMDVLGIQEIGTHDNFFELGGHSLLAMRVFAELKHRLGVELPLSAFLRAPTIAELSGLVTRVTVTSRDATSAPATAHRSESPSSVAYGDERRWRGAKNRLLQELAQVVPGARSTRVRLHRKRGVNIGENVWIGYDVVLETAHPEFIIIEDNVTINMRVVVIAHFMETAGVKIERDAFLGPGVTVLPSVVIGHGAVVAAGSVVSQSIPPMTVAQGNPAVPMSRASIPLRPNEGSLEEFSRGLTRIE